jgi:hypothetical protein
MVGAPQHTLGNGRTQAGAAYMFLGKFSAKLSAFGSALRCPGHGPARNRGWPAAAQPLNPDDMIGDLVAAAPYATGAAPQTGVVYVRFGR